MTYEPTAARSEAGGSVVVFGPNPLVEVSIRRSSQTDTVDVVAGGQPVWVARACATMGATVTLCGLGGGRPGRLLVRLLEDESFSCRLVPGPSGCFVADERSEPAVEVASQWAEPPTRLQVDALMEVTREAAAACDVLVVCNPMPGDALPLPVYTTLLAWAAERGLPVVVDLSSPRLDAALRGGPALVKLNDWELAEATAGPVATAQHRLAAMERLRGMGARSVVVTCGGLPAHTVDEAGESHAVTPPQVGTGTAAGCGDTMTGALAAAVAQGSAWLDAVVLGMAAGAAHYRGLDPLTRAGVEALAPQVSVGPGEG